MACKGFEFIFLYPLVGDFISLPFLVVMLKSDFDDVRKTSI